MYLSDVYKDGQSFDFLLGGRDRTREPLLSFLFSRRVPCTGWWSERPGMVWHPWMYSVVEL